MTPSPSCIIFPLLPTYILQKLLHPIAAAWVIPTWSPPFPVWTTAIASTFFFLLLLKLHLPNLFYWYLWGISKFMPDLFTLPLLKTLQCLATALEIWPQNPWIWPCLSLLFQFTLHSPLPLLPSFVSWVFHVPPATGSLHKLFCLTGMPITLPSSN